MYFDSKQYILFFVLVEKEEYEIQKSNFEFISKFYIR
jgi:hypothetical protein